MTGNTGIHEQMIGDDKVGGAISALSIISAELMETIRNAHLALEDCVDGRGGDVGGFGGQTTKARARSLERTNLGSASSYVR